MALGDGDEGRGRGLAHWRPGDGAEEDGSEMCRKRLNRHTERETEGAYSHRDTPLDPGARTRAKGISIWKSHVRSNRACEVAPLMCVHHASVTQQNTGGSTFCHRPG